MSAISKFQPTEEQLAVAAARKSNKARKLEAASSAPQNPGDVSSILTRHWVNTRESSTDTKNRFKVMTWNMLAQCLVRRDLFPTSDCLKASQREGLLVREIINNNSDIICLQEVDRREKLLPPLHAASYAEVYVAGPGKKHGCMILYRNSLFEKTEHVVITYDDLALGSTGDEPERRGSSRRTKNIGLIVALRRRDSPELGFIVVTTHLFWHPSFTYERIRQVALLLREIDKFQNAHSLQDWPCLLAGDFNFTPTDPAYSLLLNVPLSSKQLENIEVSRVVHMSIDPTIPTTSVAAAKDDEGAAVETDPDRIITDSRSARPEDGLLSDEELQSLFKSRALRSLYDEGHRLITSEHDNVIGARLDTIVPAQKGFYEPMWTSYTHFWKTTLDYIFILDSPKIRANVLGFLKTPRTSDFKSGLPLKGVCGSDHISLMGEIEIIREMDTN